MSYTTPVQDADADLGPTADLDAADTGTGTVLDTVNAQWYNTLAKELNLSVEEFQLSQGDVILPRTTDQLWDMMNELPTNSVVQYYTPDTLVSMSSEYTSLLSFVQAAGAANFNAAMGEANMAAWTATKQAYFQANPSAFSEPPTVLQTALQNLFQNWSMEALVPNPGSAAQCYTLYRAGFENPIYIAQELQANLPLGGPTAFNQTYEQVLADIAAAPSVNFTMESTEASSDISDSWANSSSSTGGTYFYSKSSSSQSSDFSQTFASSSFTVSVSYDHFINVAALPLSGESIEAGGTTFLPWYYGAALAYAYNNKTTEVWTDLTQWDALFGPTGSMQYVVTNLIIADGTTTITTSSQSFSTAEQTYAEQQSKEGYGCWPYYVSNSSDSTTKSSTTFNSSSNLVVETTSAAGNPIVIGVLVSSVKDLAQGG
ncbi:hypothetical protein U1701_15905 [Sphingomonas sp. PB2P19]|uniref:hypothetical protein n=1 Tax=Sphingomonas rhamnosi TaxID=3096156 RepID=UPI002FCBD1EC